MRRTSLLLLIVSAFVLFSCNDDLFDDGGNVVPERSNIINRHGRGDGIIYSLNNLTLNPDVIVLNANNSELLSSEEELSEGLIKVNTELSFSEQDVLYIHADGYTALRKIASVEATAAGSYKLQTTQAQLGELFEGGEISVSLDLYEMSKKMDEANPQLRSSVYDLNNTYEIFNWMDEFDWGNGFVYTPSTHINMSLCMQMEFAKSQLLPSRFTTYFEIQPTVNPSMAFAGSVNHTYSDDIIKYVPSQITDFIKQQEFEIDIPINTLGIESLPAKIKIKDINIPTTVEANLSKETNFAFGINGSYKVGYALEISGLRATAKPIYENSITANLPSTSELHGELLTNTEVVITPSISVLDDLYTVSGDIVFGLKTESNANANLPGNPPTYGSKGILTSRMTVLVDLLLLKVPVNLLNDEQELWNIGSFDKKIVYSDLSWKVTSKYSTNILLLSRMYETDFTVNYKYPILGKKIPDKLLVSYEVYQENGTSRITSETDLVITPTNVTANSFAFKLNIPYKSKLLSYQTKSYLKNIVIKDSNGYIYEGIYNTAKGVNENSFEIKR